MKRAVAHLEHYLDKVDGPDQGQGRAGDGLRRRPRHRQEPGQHDPLEQRLHGLRPGQAGAAQHRSSTRRVEVGADAIGLSALLVSTSKQMPLCVQELDARGLTFPVLDRRRGDQPRLRPAHALPGGRRALRAGRLLLQGRLRGAGDDGPAARPGAARGAARDAGDAEARAPRDEVAHRPPPPAPAAAAPGAPRSAARAALPTPPFLGRARVADAIPPDDVWRGMDLKTLYRLHWGGKNARRSESSGWSPRSSSRAWSACRPRRSREAGSRRGPSTATSRPGRRRDLVVFDPSDGEREARAASPSRASRGARAAVPRRLLPHRRRRRAGRGRASRS